MELLIYLLKVSACTAFFFGFYLVTLRKLTFFEINRFYLLGTLFLSFVIPAVKINIAKEAEIIETQVPIALVKTHDVGVLETSRVEILPMPVTEIPFDWFSIIPYIYFSVAAVLLVVCFWQLYRLIRFAKDYKENHEGLKLISKKKGFTNCSFFNYVFVNETNLSETDLQVLLKHEQVHANQYHSVDKIVLMIAKAILWFNPIIYLFDKALEQTHEYEADEATSQSFGNNAYANLLLRLVVVKTNTALIHNFVKSPIKERIKMLFNSKSKNMKKLNYLLVLPIGLCLLWLFSVQIVYAQSERKVRMEMKRDSVIGKTLRGTVTKKGKSGTRDVINLSVGTNDYLINSWGFKDKTKVGDELSVFFNGVALNWKRIDKNGKLIDESKERIYEPGIVKSKEGDVIYKMIVAEKIGFHYEMSKARQATSRIKFIVKNANGTLNKIVLNDGEFTISLNVDKQNFKSNDFKIGDSVLVKFIGERLVAKKTYSTDKMIALYSQPKKYLLKNEALFNRFYDENGRQKVDILKSDAEKDLIPKIISSSSITGDVNKKISYLKDAVIEILGSTITAKYVELNQNEKVLIADHAVITNGGSMIVAEQAVFNLLDGTYRAYESNSEAGEKISFNDFSLKENENMIAKRIHYSALDSTRISMDKSVISLYGKAKINFKDVTIDADEITYNIITQMGSAKNMVITQANSGSKIKGISAKFNLNGKIEVWQNVNGSIVVEH